MKSEQDREKSDPETVKFKQEVERLRKENEQLSQKYREVEMLNEKLLMAYAEMKRTKEYLHDLINFTNDKVLLMDTKGQIVGVSAVFGDWVGYSRNWLLKLSIFQLLLPENVEKVRALLNQVQLEIVKSFETVLLSSKGKEIKVKMNNLVMEEKNRKLVLCTFYDIDKLKAEKGMV